MAATLCALCLTEATAVAQAVSAPSRAPVPDAPAPDAPAPGQSSSPTSPAPSASRASAPTFAPLPIRLTYSAGPDCPGLFAFREGVSRRAPELRDAAPSEPAREFAAVVQVLGDGRAVGTLLIREATGVTASRRVEGTNCVEVANALAFIVAELGRSLKLDERGNANGEAPVSASNAGPAANRGAAPRAELIASAATKSASPAERPPPEIPGDLYFDAGFALDVVRAPAPSWLLSPVLHVEVGWAPERRYWLLSARISGTRGSSNTLRSSAGDALFEWTAMRLDLCGLSLGHRAFRATACAALDMGELQGSGSGTEQPQRHDALWVAPGALARGQMVFSRHLVLELETSVFVPLVRPEFFFARGSDSAERDVVHRVPALGFRAGFGVAVRFL